MYINIVIFVRNQKPRQRLRGSRKLIAVRSILEIFVQWRLRGLRERPDFFANCSHKYKRYQIKLLIQGSA